ncbi:MAG: carbohydrate ABC transporter permease [Acidimicrobiia bacterium]
MSTLNVADFEVETVPNRTAGKQAARDTTKSRSLGLGLLAPVLVFFAILNVIPTLWMIGLGFFDYTLGGGDPEFVGFDNFVLIYESAEQWATFTRTLFFMVVAVSIEVALGVVLGFRFWGIARMPGRRVALTMLFTPMVVAPVASGLFWKLMYEPTFGVINYVVDLFGGTKIDFLTDVEWVTPAVLAVDIWMWTPFMILMTLAALGSVPTAELEAADIDRLSFLQRVRHVIWPNGKFILMLGILLRTIDAFKTTDLVLTMTKGGPGNKTEFLGLALYRQAFNSFDLGRSSAVALVLLIIAIALTSIYLYVLNLSRDR